MQNLDALTPRFSGMVWPILPIHSNKKTEMIVHQGLPIIFCLIIFRCLLFKCTFDRNRFHFLLAKWGDFSSSVYLSNLCMGYSWHFTVSRMFSMFSVLQHRSQRLGKFGTNLYTNQTTILELPWNWHVYGLMMFTIGIITIGITRNNLPCMIHTGQVKNQWGLTLTINDGDEKSATTETVLLANPTWQWNILHLWFMLVYLPLKSVISDSHLWLLEVTNMYTSEKWHRR